MLLSTIHRSPQLMLLLPVLAVLFGTPVVYAQQPDLFSLLQESELTTMLDWFQQANMTEDLKGKGSTTLFAPVNEAFDKLSPSIVWKLKSDAEFLKSVLQYHMIQGQKGAIELVNQGKTITLQGEEIEMLTGQGLKVAQEVSNASVTRRDIEASNGVLHIVDQLLLPPSLQEEPNLIEVMRSKDNLKSFLMLVEKAGMVDTLREGGPLTVFAPTDAAFDAVDPSILRQLQREPRLLKAVILSHLVDDDLSSFHLRSTTIHQNNLGELVILRTIRNIVLVNTARVIEEDLIASNGALHIIDDLLLPSINALGSQGHPPTSNLMVKVERSGLSIFTELLKKSGISRILQLGGPLTVFVPSDGALSTLPIEEVQKLNNDLEYLRVMILRHILPESFLANDFREDQLVDNLSGEKTRLNFYRRTNSGTIYTVNGVKLIVMDERATNGVIHVIESVLPSTKDNALEVLRNDHRFSTFLSAIQTTALTGALRSGEPVTVFAATNEAFQQLPQDELFSLLFDLSGLTDLNNQISNHVVSNGTSSTQTLFSPGLCWNSFTAASGNKLRTAMGSDGHVLLSAGEGRVVRIIEADIIASNGVVHVVDGLL